MIILPPATGMWFGVATVDHLGTLTDFATAAETATGLPPGGQEPVLFEYYNAWADINGPLDFNTTKADYIHNTLGKTPVITWEPWDTSHRDAYDNASVVQHCYQLSKIIEGQHDDYIRDWATAVGSLSYPVFVRFAHEMNGSWYPWAEAANHNSPGEYVAAWRHVRRIFRQRNVTNVTWIWAPNVGYTSALSGLYPGNAWVDWIGIDGYNFGDPWQTFEAVFDATLTNLPAVKPVMITETACTEVGAPVDESKATWIDDFFVKLPGTIPGPPLTWPVINAFIWFNIEGSLHDWRIQSSTAAEASFATGIDNLSSLSLLAPP